MAFIIGIATLFFIGYFFYWIAKADERREHSQYFRQKKDYEEKLFNDYKNHYTPLEKQKELLKEYAASRSFVPDEEMENYNAAMETEKKIYWNLLCRWTEKVEENKKESAELEEYKKTHKIRFNK